MTSESDWAAADAMTDEEIEAAIASDPDENQRDPDWPVRTDAIRYITGYLDTWHPRAPVTILKEAGDRYLVRLEQDASRPNGQRVTAGTVTYEPKRDVVFA